MANSASKPPPLSGVGSSPVRGAGRRSSVDGGKPPPLVGSSGANTKQFSLSRPGSASKKSGETPLSSRRYDAEERLATSIATDDRTYIETLKDDIREMHKRATALTAIPAVGGKGDENSAQGMVELEQQLSRYNMSSDWGQCMVTKLSLQELLQRKTDELNKATVKKIRLKRPQSGKSGSQYKSARVAGAVSVGDHLIDLDKALVAKVAECKQLKERITTLRTEQTSLIDTQRYMRDSIRQMYSESQSLQAKVTELQSDLKSRPSSAAGGPRNPFFEGLLKTLDQSLEKVNAGGATGEDGSYTLVTTQGLGRPPTEAPAAEESKPAECQKCPAWSRRVESLNGDLEKKNNSIAKLRELCDTLKEEKATLEKDVAELQSKLDNLPPPPPVVDPQVIVKLEEKVKILVVEKNDVSKKLESAEKKVASLENSNATLTRNAREDSAKMDELKEKTKSALESVSEYEKAKSEITSLKATVASLKSDLEDANGYSKALQSKLEENQKLMESLRGPKPGIVEVKEEDMKRTKEEAMASIKEISRLSASLEQMEVSLQQCKEENERVHEDARRATEQLESVDRDHEKTVAGLKEQIRFLDRKVVGLEKSISDANAAAASQAKAQEGEKAHHAEVIADYEKKFQDMLKHNDKQILEIINARKKYEALELELMSERQAAAKERDIMEKVKADFENEKRMIKNMDVLSKGRIMKFDLSSSNSEELEKAARESSEKQVRQLSKRVADLEEELKAKDKYIQDLMKWHKNNPTEGGLGEGEGDENSVPLEVVEATESAIKSANDSEQGDIPSALRATIQQETGGFSRISMSYSQYADLKKRYEDMEHAIFTIESENKRISDSMADYGSLQERLVKAEEDLRVARAEVELKVAEMAQLNSAGNNGSLTDRKRRRDGSIISNEDPLDTAKAEAESLRGQLEEMRTILDREHKDKETTIESLKKVHSLEKKEWDAQKVHMQRVNGELWRKIESAEARAGSGVLSPVKSSQGNDIGQQSIVGGKRPADLRMSLRKAKSVGSALLNTGGKSIPATLGSGPSPRISRALSITGNTTGGGQKL